MSVTACLSHKEDVDGFLSAVFIKAVFAVVLADCLCCLVSSTCSPANSLFPLLS